MSNLYIQQNSNLYDLKTSTKKKESLQSVEVFIFFLGVMSSFYLDATGQLYVTEIILILLFPILWIRNRRFLLQNRYTGRIILFGFIWFFGQAITDLIRATSTQDLLRGWAAILVFLISFCSLYFLVENNIRRIQFFILGYALGALAATQIQPSIYFFDEPWKFGYGFPVIMLVLLWISYKVGNNKKVVNRWIFPLLVLGGLSFFWNARALGGVVIVTAFLIWLRNHKIGRTFMVDLNLRNILVGLLMSGLVFWGLSSIYGFAAERGYLGEKERSKFTQQAGGQFGLLIGGRSEILVSTRAIADSPWIGHGSWAKDRSYRRLMYELINLGYEQSEFALKRLVESSDLIPAHSHIFQAWVWSGILGALFWVVILWIIFQAFILSNRYPDLLHIFVVFFSVTALWDIFFSPFGSIMRLRWSMQLVVILVSIHNCNQIKKKLALEKNNLIINS
jgi:hypothetical protein